MQSLKKLIKSVDVNLNNWHRYSAIFKGEVDADPIEKALSVFFLNRTNRSGILHAGPIGGQKQSGDYLIDCRFNKQNLIERIENIAKLKRKIIVKNEDASSLVFKLNKSNCFIYADPPYVKQGKNIYIVLCKKETLYDIIQVERGWERVKRLNAPRDINCACGCA